MINNSARKGFEFGTLPNTQLSNNTIQYNTIQYNTIQYNTIHNVLTTDLSHAYGSSHSAFPEDKLWTSTQFVRLHLWGPTALKKQEYQLSRWTRCYAGKRLKTCISLRKRMVTSDKGFSQHNDTQTECKFFLFQYYRLVIKTGGTLYCQPEGRCGPSGRFCYSRK